MNEDRYQRSFLRISRCDEAPTLSRILPITASTSLTYDLLSTLTLYKIICWDGFRYSSQSQSLGHRSNGIWSCWNDVASGPLTNFHSTAGIDFLWPPHHRSDAASYGFDLQKHWDMTKRCCSPWRETATLFMRLLRTLSPAIVMLIKYAFTNIKERRTDTGTPGSVRAEEWSIWPRITHGWRY